MLSLACEMKDCSFRTPSINEEHFPALVKLLEVIVIFLALDCQDLFVQIHSVSVHGLDVGTSSTARTILEAPVPRGRRGELELGVREAPGSSPGQAPGNGKVKPCARFVSVQVPGTICMDFFAD